ncbi:MAG: hypothetical protein GY756_12180 [bacterium]|nr:hypothetical protein [bacterium]
MLRKSLILLLITVLSTVGLYAANSSERLQKDVKLYQGHSIMDPYTLYYDFKIKNPGLIRVAFDVLSARPRPKKSGKIVMIRLVAKNQISKKGAGKQAKIDVKSRGGKFEYPVDALLFESSKGEFRIFVSNISSKTAVSGKLSILYPGKEKPATSNTQTAQKPIKDLAIEKIYLNKDNNVCVLIKNKGNRYLGNNIWNNKVQNNVSIFLKRNNKNWGGSTIWRIDPKRRLAKPNGWVIYKSNLHINGKTRVTAYIKDTSNILKEPEKNNNSKSLILTPKTL